MDEPLIDSQAFVQDPMSIIVSVNLDPMVHAVMLDLKMTVDLFSAHTLTCSMCSVSCSGTCR